MPSRSMAPRTTTRSSVPYRSARALTMAWLSRSMAPLAVQTKHSVRIITTSAPADLAASARASPAMLSRSPSAITFLPLFSIASSCQQAVDRRLDLLTGHVATSQSFDLGAVAQGDVGRQPHDLELPGDRAILLVARVDLDQP